MHISGYSSIFNFGHKAVDTLFDGPVVIQEKIDGSQFSFGIYGGVLACRSKGKDIVMDAPDKMFGPAVGTVKSLAPRLRDGWTYRGEFLGKPKHNTLAYERVPTGHIVLYDIDAGEQDYIGPHGLESHASEIGLESVPFYHCGFAKLDPEWLGSFLSRTPMLGGKMIEGVVIKNYAQFGPDKKILMGKWVSDEFKESHRKEWKISNPGPSDVVAHIIDTYRTEARWQKAVQHLAERGELTGDVTDIGKLLNEAKADIERECSEEIARMLMKWAMPKVLRGAVGGLPEWYKEKVTRAQMERIQEAVT